MRATAAHPFLRRFADALGFRARVALPYSDLRAGGARDLAHEVGPRRYDGRDFFDRWFRRRRDWRGRRATEQCGNGEPSPCVAHDRLPRTSSSLCQCRARARRRQTRRVAARRRFLRVGRVVRTVLSSYPLHRTRCDEARVACHCEMQPLRLVVIAQQAADFTVPDRMLLAVLFATSACKAAAED